ncbi:sugar transferase [Patescibacteria group bacterium]|nr:sugar transferase [Patescibacteria group bacterium]
MNRLLQTYCLDSGFIRYPLRLEELVSNGFINFNKRTFDVIFSMVILLLLFPLFVIIALLVRLDSAGPIIFKQKRVGKDGEFFTIYKFRSMRINSDPDPKNYQPINLNDQRITRPGRFLRATCLDELPQFFNVLNGDMSIVGPRPEIEFVADEYDAIQRKRLLVKPGITGIWQLTADRSIPIHKNLDYDLCYLENRSFILDLEIIARTVLVMFRGLQK